MEELAATHGRSHPALIDKLLNSPRQFRLFQAIRLIELLRSREQSARTSIGLVGETHSPQQEAIRLGSVAKSRFAGSEIEEVTESPGGVDPRRAKARFQLVTSALGLTGPTGTLPRHYTALLLERLKRHDHAMEDFFDLFNHRSLSLFYRAWAKHRPEVDFESSRVYHPRADKISTLLNSLVGQGIPALLNRAVYDDNTLIFHAGLFSAKRRTASGLETILSATLKTNITIQQFQPHWLNLDVDQCTRLGVQNDGSENNQLGMTAICGERVFDVQSRFRIVISARSYRQFTTLLPGQRQLKITCDLTRRYVGMEFDFDVQVEIAGEDVPESRLSSEAENRPQLGRNCWLRSRPMLGLVRDAVFVIDDAA